jgi:hypothetical protein
MIYPDGNLLQNLVIQKRANAGLHRPGNAFLSLHWKKLFNPETLVSFLWVLAWCQRSKHSSQPSKLQSRLRCGP